MQTAARRASESIMKRSRSPHKLFFLVLGGLLSTPAVAAAPMVPGGETVRIADGVYVIPDQGVPLVPNVGIVVGDESVLVIDTGMGPANAEIVLSEVRKISRLPIRYLATTHFHPEHNFGAQSFPEPTVLIYSIEQHRDLQNKGERYRDWFGEMFGDDVRRLLEPVKLVQPDVTFRSEARIDLGDLPVELHYFGHPAHTGGDTVVFLPRQKVAFAGGLTPNRLFPILPDADSSVTGWLATLESLSQLDAGIIVPGHGPIGDAGLVGQVREYLTAIRTRARELKRRGVALSSAQDTLYAEFTERYPDWGERHWIRAAVERAYAEVDGS